MARARNIKPGFFKNEYLGSLEPHARLLFIGLWMLADREGRLEDRPLRIKAEVFPYESVQVEKLLDKIDSCGGNLIKRYSVNGEKFIQICNFIQHQNPHKNEKPSEIPAFNENNREKERSTLEKDGSTQEKAQPNRAESLLLNPESFILKDESVTTVKSPAAAVNKIIDLYHETCKDYPKIIKVTEKRKQHVIARYKEYNNDMEVFKTLFAKAQGSNFLKGQNNRDWKADFDWLLNQTNMAKVLEGKYDENYQKEGSKHEQVGANDTGTKIPEGYFPEDWD